MNIDIETKQKALRARKRMNGLIYGLIAGLAFTGAAWGLDALLLSQANAVFPWLKILIGGLAALLVFGLAGFLTASADSPLVGLVTWFAAGLAMAWVGTRLPFEGFAPALMSLFDPVIGEVAPFPFTEFMGARMWVVFFVVVPLASIAGLLEMAMVDSANNATAPLARLFPLLACLPLLVLAGGGLDNMVNGGLRAPVIALNDLIEFSIQTAGKPVDRTLARQMHLGSLNAVLDQIQPERRLVLGSYDDEIMMVHVLVDFGDTWVDCTVVDSQPSYCKPAEQAQLEEAGVAAPASSSTGATGAASSEPAENLAPTPPAAQTSPSPEVGETPAANTTLPGLAGIPEYSISLQVDFEQHTFEGQSTVEYTNQEDLPLNSLYFRLFPNGKVAYGNGSLQVSEVLVDGQPAATELSLDDTVLEVKLPAPLAAHQQTQLNFDFSGVVPVDFGGGENPSGYGIYNFSQNVLALGSWYPILAVYDQRGWNLNPPSDIGDSVFSDIAHYTVDVTVSDLVTVVATGIETSRQEENGQLQIRFSSGPVRDFFLILSPDFKLWSQETDGITVNAYALPGQDQGGQVALQVAVDSLQAFNDIFGKYPYPELDVVSAPMRNASGVEFPGTVLVSSALYAQPDDPSFAVTTAHEVAHQWWYNVVGNDVYEEPWLDEALTTYSSAIYMEFKVGQPAVQGLYNNWQQRYNRLKTAGGDDQVAQSLEYFESLNDSRVYGGVVYVKGGLFFKALREEIGDEAFFTALKRYYETYQYKIAERADLLAAFEESSGRQLDEFYHQWLFTS